VGLLDKEELKELLYLELVLTRQVEELITRLKKAGHELKALGEALEKHPLLSPLTPSEETAACRHNPVFPLLLKEGGVFSLTTILSDLASLKRQRGTLADIKKRLEPARNPGKSRNGE